MADLDPRLQEQLRKLDEELEEGDITRKGYEKRRTRILSQFIPPQNAPSAQRGGLRIHSPDDSDHPASVASKASSRNASLAALTSGSSTMVSRNDTLSDYHPTMTRQLTAFQDEPQLGNGTPRSYSPQGPVQRFQEREAASLSSMPRSASDHLYDSRRGTLTADSSSPDASRSHTLMSQNYAFIPGNQQDYSDTNGEVTRNSTMLDSQQGFFSDFAGQQREDPRESYGGGPQRYSQSEPFSPTMQNAPPLLTAADLRGGAAIHQMPLEPRDIPFPICDPHNSLTEMSQFENVAMVLRHRAKTNPKQPAYWVLDQRGKEVVSITWDKLASRAEKVAQVIRDKSSLYRGDRVALIYTEAEIIEFAVALMGCFIAGVVAVPINDLRNYQRLNVILTSTQAHLALTTEANLKNFQRDITAAKQNWPRGVEWWKTNEFGSYHPKKKSEEAPVIVPDLAYIEFATAPTGDLRGVVMSHRTIMHQMATLSAILATASPNTADKTFDPNLRDKNGHLVTGGSRYGEVILSYLDARQSIGMIIGVLLAVYGGHTMVWMDQKTIDTPGLYAHLITKYKATLVLADYPGLKRTAYNYQSDPMTTRNFKKGVEPNFSSVKLCLIDTLTVDSEFHELLADRWLKPLRNPRARDIVAPMLCLPEHGGMIISMRDWLGGEERMGCSLAHEMHRTEPDEEKKDHDNATNKTGFGSSLIGGNAAQQSKPQSTVDLGEILLDKEALKTNDIQVLAMGADAAAKASTFPNAVRCGAFGYPIPDATLAIVDPETNLLCSPNSVGEIWVDSPSLSGGFWALPKHTESIFHARPYAFKEGTPTPTAIDPEFLRTGLLGCVIEGKIYVLGLYEDRIRQKVEWVEHGLDVQESRYFFVQHLILSIMKNVPKIHDASAFDVYVNDEHLPIVLLESYAASTAPTTSGGPPRQLDIPLLDSLSERTMEVLYQEHHLRVYCVMITAPGILPRVIRNGRREIGNMLCRNQFDNGSLPCVHVKFGVERAVLNLPVGVDPVGGIWSPVSSGVRQEILQLQEKQYSGVDYREVVIDDRTSAALSNFNNIFEIMQWRVARQGEELAYCTVDGRGKEGKGVTWKKFDTRVAAVAMYLKNKVRIKPSDHVILMYTHSEEYVFAFYACLVLGAIAIPVAPLDQNRLAEDAPAYLHIVGDMRVKAVLVNAEVNDLFKVKIVSQHLKQSAQYLKVNIPNVYNTAKPPKQSHGCRDLGLAMNKAWVTPSNPVLIWTYWTPDQRRVSIQLGHDTILGMCKVQRETCQMTSSKPVLGCVRSTVGLGFIHTCLMGIYNGSATYLISPLDFAQNPTSLFLALSRYKVKDTYATSQMLEFAMANMAGKGFSLHELKNLMVATDSRPPQHIFAKVRSHFSITGLDRTAINTIYSHVLNPMIASRSYMSIEPIELWLDPRALRRGLVYPVDPDTEPGALCMQDSGMVPVSTQIAIVNPETCQLCHIGEYGEIWVQSEASAKSFYMSKQDFDAERFNGRIMGGDPNATYVRTGDLGFLHNVTRPIGANNQPVEMQILFVLGNIGETFEVNGLNHFPIDIENSVERCHRNITPGGCAVFQAGGLVVILVEVYRKAYLASIVPVIVDAVLNEHQLVVDIVAFVGQGDFPRSRLAEKQRGRILASWVTRKLRTIAQFGIRDPEAAGSEITEVPEPRSRGGTSVVSKSVKAPGDVTRTSIVSESPEHIRVTNQSSDNGGTTGNPSLPPELPLSLPPNHYQIDPTGFWEPSQDVKEVDTPAITVNDRHYSILPEGISEMPANPYEHNFDDAPEHYDEDDEHEKFYDPNGDPFHPYGDSTPQQASSDEDLVSQNRHLPHLSIMNPSEYLEADNTENTPSTSTASQTQTATPTPISAIRRTGTSETVVTTTSNSTGWTDESPYEDQGNPFANNIPASVPSFDFISSPASRSSARVSSPTPPGMPAPLQPRGRAALPSQQARFNPSTAGTVPVAELDPGGPSSRLAMGPAELSSLPPRRSFELPPRPDMQVRKASEESWPEEALLYSNHAHNGNLTEQQRLQQQRDLESVAGSVRKRYDGSGWD